MKLVDNLSGIGSYYLVISGNGTFPEKDILKTLCQKYDGHDNAIFHISTPIKKQTGLDALNAINLLSQKFRINSIIFMVDGEHFEENASIEIIEHLESKGIEIKENIFLQEAILIKCKSGPHDIILYCIILGPEIFVEEEVAKLIELKLGVNIDLSQKGNPDGRKFIKRQIKQVLRENKKTIKELVISTGKNKLEQLFPNICAVLKRIEGEQ